MGTMGIEGAFEAMGEGTVDINWAKEHHNLWVSRKMLALDQINCTDSRRQRPGE